jgi:hypothetical protein
LGVRSGDGETSLTRAAFARIQNGQKEQKNDAGSKAEHHYFRVVITYSDGETSGNRVFKNHEKAEEWAVRQKKSPVVKKAVIEPFMQDAYAASKVRRGHLFQSCGR